MGDVEREQEQESGEDNRPVSIMSESTRPGQDMSDDRGMTDNNNSELDSSCQKTQKEESGTGQNGLFSTNPGQNDKGQTDPGQHEQGQTDTDQPEQSQADPGQNDQSQTDDPGQHEQSQTDPGQHEQGQTDPGQSDQSQTHSSQNDEDQTDPGDEKAQSIPEMKTADMSGPTRDPQSLESSRECQLEKDEEGHIQEAVHSDASQDTQPGMAASSAVSSAVSQAESPTVKGCIALSSAENPASPKLTTVSDQTGQEPCHNEQGQIDPGQSEPEQTDPVQSEPGQADLVQIEEGQTDPVQSEYDQTYLVLSEEGQTDPVPIEHGQTDPGQIEQDQTDPVECEQGQTYLVLSEEGQTDPVPIEHGQTDPGQIEQGPTDPVQSEQGPTDPVQSEQGPTDPGQSQNAQSNAVRKPVEDCEGLESPMAKDEGQIQVQGEASKDSQSDMAVNQAGIVSSTANPGIPELSEDAGQTSREAQPGLPGSSSQGTAQQPAQVQSQPTRGILIREHFCKKLLAFVRKNYPVKTRQNVENRINSFEIELASDAGFVWMHKDNNDKMIHQLVEHLHLHPTSTWKLRLLRRVVINSLPKWSPSMKMQVNRLCKQLLMGEGANARANISQLMKVMTVRLPRGNKQRRGKSQVEQSQTGGQERAFPISRKLSKILSKIEWRLAQGLFINQKDLKMYEKYREELRKREGEIQQQRREGKDVSSQGTQPALAASSTVSHVASSTASQEANSAVQAVGSSDSSSKTPVLPKLATDSNQTSQEPQPTLPGPSSQDTTQEPARAQKGITGGTLVSEPFCKMLLASVQQHFTEWKKETTKQFINNFEEELKGNAEFLWGRHDKTIEELAERLQLPPGSVWKLQLLRKLNLRGLAKSNPSQLERNMQMFLQILREEFNSKVVDISELMKVIYLPVLKSIKQESEQSDLTKPDRVSDQTCQQSQPDLPGVSSQGATQQPAGSQEEGWRGSLSLNKFSQNLLALVEDRYSNEKVKKKVEHRINKFEEELHTACEWKSVHNNDEEIVKLAARLKLLPGSVWKLRLLRRVVMGCLPKRRDNEILKAQHFCRYILLGEKSTCFKPVMPQLMKVMMPTMQTHGEKGSMERQTADRKEQEWLSAGAKEQEYFSDRHKRLLWHLQSKQAKGQHMSKKELNSLKWLKKRQQRATQMERQKLQVQEQRSARSRKDQRQSEERRGMKRGSRERYLPDQRKVSKHSPSRQVARLERVEGQQRKRRDSGREEQQPGKDGQSEARHSKSHQLAVDVEKMLLQKEWERLAGERKALDYELALREAAVQEHIFQMQHAVYTHKVTREVTQVTQHSKHLPLEAGHHGNHSEQQMSANHDVDYRHVQVTSESSSLSGDRSHKHFPGDPHLDDRSPIPYDHKRLHGDPVLDDRSLIPYDQDLGRFHTDLLHGDSSLMCPDDTAPRDWSPERDANIPYYRRQPQYEEDWQGRSYSFKSDEEDEFLHDPYRRDALADRYGEPYRPKQAVGSYRDDPPFLVPGSLPYDNSVFSAEPPPDIRDAPYIRNDRRQEQTLQQASHVDFVRSLKPGQSPYYDLDEFGWPVAPSPHEGYKSPPVVPGFHGNLRHGNRQFQGHSQMPGKMRNKAGKRNKSHRDQHRNPRSNSQSWGRDPRSNSQSQGRDSRSNSQNQGRDPRSNSQGRDHRSSSQSKGRDPRSNSQGRDPRSNSQSFDRDHRSNSQSFDTNQRSNNRREDQRSSSESQWERNNRSSRRGQGRDSRSNSQSQGRDSRSNSQSQGRDSRSSSQGQGISGDHNSISQRQGGHRFTQSFDPGQSRDRSQHNSQPGQNNIQQKPPQTGRNSQNSAKRQRSGSPSPRGTKKGPGEMGAPKCPPKQQQTVDTQMWPLQAPGTVMQQNVQIPNSQAIQSQDFGLIQDNQTMQSQDFGLIQDNQTMQSQDFGQIQDNQTMQSQDFDQIQDNQTMQSQDFGQIPDNQTMQSQVFGQLPTKEATRPQEISQRVQSSWHDDCLEGDFLDFGKESAVSFQGSIQQTVLPAASATRETSTFSGGDDRLLSPTGKATDRPESEQVACLPPVVIPPGLSFTEKLLVVVETFGPITKQEVQKRLPKFELEVKKEVVNRRRTYDDLLIDQLGDSIPEQHRWKLKLLRRIIVDTMSQTTPEGREKVSWLCHQLLPQEGIELTDEVLKALMAKRMLVNPLLKPMVITGMGAGIGTTAKRSRKSVVMAYLQQQGIRPTEETVHGILQNEQMVDKILKTLGHRQQLFGAEASRDTHQGAGVSQDTQQGTQKDTLLGATVNTAVSQAVILPSEGNATLSSNRESQPLPGLSSERTGPECMPNEERGGNTALSSNRESQSLPGPSSERKGPKKGPRQMPNEERGGTLILTPFAQKLAAFVEKTYGEEKKIKVVHRINTFEEELKGNAEFFWRRGQNNDKMIEQLAERLQLPHGSVWKLQLLRRVSVDCLPKKTEPARERILEMCQHVLFDEGIKVTDEIFKVILAIVPRHLQGSLATTTRDPTSSVASIRESSGLTSGNPTSFVENLRESSGMTSGNPTSFEENLQESLGMTTGYQIPFAEEEMLQTVPSTSTGVNMALPSNRELQSLPGSSLQGPFYNGPIPKEVRGGTLILTPFAQKLVAFVKKTYGKKIETRVVDRINTFEEERKGNPDFFWTRIQNNDMVIKQIAERRNLPPESFWKLQLLRRVTVDCLPKTNLPQRVLQMCQHLLFNEGVAVTDEIFKVIVTRISKNPQPPTPFVENLQDSSAMTTGYSIPFVKGEMLRTVPSTSTGGQSSSTSTGGQSSVPNTHSQTLEQVSDKHQMVVAYLMSMGVHVTTEAVEGILQNQQALDSIERIFWTPIQDRQLVQEYLQMINIPVTPDAVNKIMENPELMRRIKNTLGAPGANVGPPGTSRGGQ